MLKFACQSCFFLYFVCCNVAFSQSQSDKLAERVRNEAPKAWRLYLSSLDKIKFDFNETGTVDNKNVTSSAGSLILAYPNLSYKVTKDANTYDTTHIVNKYYEFVVEESKNSDVNVKNVNKLLEISSADRTRFPLLFDHDPSTLEIAIARNLTRGLSLSVADWLPTTFEQPEFQIISAKELSEDNEQLVCINYRYEPVSRP
ncbi:MAG: hypothetical protein LBU65_00385, partial [Planctomycetaceae bacterium]|nr:hypothetical protein [Planctomycetaceae bacterium]